MSGCNHSTANGSDEIDLCVAQRMEEYWGQRRRDAIRTINDALIDHRLASANQAKERAEVGRLEALAGNCSRNGA